MSPRTPVRAIPTAIRYPEELPVVARREEIARAIREHQVVVVAGETGSGKTTQIPKICLELGRGVHARIGHTQPRRLAARTVAQRIADELDTPLGALVGYQVRFNDQVSDATAIKLMTDGILLAGLQGDRELREYDTLIIDEAHERSLNIDFILGYLKQLLPRRPDLKVVITSATIDVERFSRHFNDAPVVEVSGRTYPVTVHYVGDTEDRDTGVREQIVGLLADIEDQRFGPRGDVLVFLPGEREIRELAHDLRGADRLQVLPLYARLSRAEQNRVFNPSGAGMRVILATNVAETSVTVPGIRYVIDPGDARISRYSHRSRLQRLPVEKISQASANQRMGRCGRIAAGVCLRLYSEDDFLARPEFTDPEILRTNLAQVILQMLQLGLGDVQGFPFLDPPEPKMVREGYRTLEELSAVSQRGRLTALGRKMARLPVDPRLGRMLLAAADNHCVEDVLVIVSALAVQDPRERPADRRAQADQQHARFADSQSDLLVWLNLWRYYESQRQALSQNQLRKLCQREFLAFLRMREWRDIHSQLLIACRQLGIRPRAGVSDDPDYAAIHKALLSGLLGNIAQQDEGRSFNGARNRKLTVFPGSGLYRKPPKWLVAAEIVETTQVYARQCARIEPEWLPDINPALLKRHHYAPAWQQRAGRVMAKERVTLFGLTVSDGKRVDFAEVDPTAARELFVREGLVPGALQSPPGFLKHNLRLVREIEGLESRARRRDLLVDEESLVRFYDERLPDICTGVPSLTRWLREDAGNDAALRLSRDQVLVRDPGAELESAFPQILAWGGVEYRLSYTFEPGNSNDGVSVTIPRMLLNRAPRYRFEWLVPGLLRDKCIALIKGLPKALRKQLVPVPDVVDALLAEVQPDDVPLCTTLGAALKRLRRVDVAAGDWDEAGLDDFYRMNIRVVDDRGKLLAEGRDMAALVAQFRDAGSDGVSAVVAADSPERDRVERWDFGALPDVWQTRSAGMPVTAFPALVAGDDGLAVRLFDYRSDALGAHREGVAALAGRLSAQTVKYLRKALFASNRAALAFAGAGLERQALVGELIVATAVDLAGEPLPRDERAFDAALARIRADWVSRAAEYETGILTLVEAVAGARRLLKTYPAGDYRDSREDIEGQIAGLVGEGAIRTCPGDWLGEYPRFGRALLLRAERLRGQYPKDQSAMALLAPASARWFELAGRYPGIASQSRDASTYRWMLEEFRVSLFAQQLGTRVPVSAKRLDQQWQAVQAWVAENPR